MKKKLRLISAVLLLAILISSVAMLSSCAVESADRLWEKLDGAMEALSSYRADMETKMVFYVDGKSVNADVSAVQIESKDGGNGEYYFYSSAKSNIKSLYLDIEESTKVLQAYNEGVFYLYRTGKGEKASRLAGDLSVDEFKSYVESSSDSNIDVVQSTKSKISKNKDGTHTAEFSGFPKKEVERVFGSFGGSKELFGFDVKDVTVKIVYDKEYLVSLMTYVFEFDMPENAKYKPSASVSMKYSEHNSAKRIYTNISPTQYKKTEHIKAVIELDKKFKEMRKANEGAFDLEASQTVSGTGSPEQSYNEKDKIKYGYRDGAYYYDITADVSGNEVLINYSNGLQKITTGSVSQKNDQTEDEAIKFIEDLIDTARYDPVNVISIEKDPAPDKPESEEIYVIKLDDLDKSKYEALAKKLGLPQYGGVNHSITAQFVNGELVYLQSVINMGAYGATIQIVATYRFPKSTDSQVDLT